MMLALAIHLPLVTNEKRLSIDSVESKCYTYVNNLECLL
jgi:hypothetical protein